jgi:hypothetical protein
MTLYKNAHCIVVGQWLFYPELLMARNIHNGNPVLFSQRADGTWVAQGINIPAWMFEQLCKWFFGWINGTPSA